jgi:hypothetical protein
LSVYELVNCISKVASIRQKLGIRHTRCHADRSNVAKRSHYVLGQVECIFDRSAVCHAIKLEHGASVVVSVHGAGQRKLGNLLHEVLQRICTCRACIVTRCFGLQIPQVWFAERGLSLHTLQINKVAKLSAARPRARTDPERFCSIDIVSVYLLTIFARKNRVQRKGMLVTVCAAFDVALHRRRQTAMSIALKSAEEIGGHG